MVRAFKYRIYPTKKQIVILNDTLTTCRFLYNTSLNERITEYKTNKKFLSYVQQANNLSKNKNQYQEKVHSQVLQNTLKRLDKSFQNFFRRLKEKNFKAGFPRFKSEHRYNSFIYPQGGFKLSNSNKRIELSKVGSIKLVYSRPIIGIIKTCTVLRDEDQWFVVLTCEIDKLISIKSTNPSVGIDLGLMHLAVISDGNVIENPKFLKQSEHKLKELQRRHSRKIKGSNNRNKSRILLRRQHRKIRNQRTDFLHKLSTQFVNTYGEIIFEKLNIKGMVKNHNFARSILDASWNQLVLLTQQKAESAGVVVKLVDPRNTSQECSGCGSIVKKTLAERTHNCPHCGLVMDRDLNASVNIKNRAGHAQFQACGDLSSTLKNSNSMQDRSVKQEFSGS